MNPKLYEWLMSYDFPQGPFNSETEWKAEFDKFCRALAKKRLDILG